MSTKYDWFLNGIFFFATEYKNKLKKWIFYSWTNQAKTAVLNN